MRCWLPGKEGSETPFAAAQCEAVEAGGLLKLKLDDGGHVTVDPTSRTCSPATRRARPPSTTAR